MKHFLRGLMLIAFAMQVSYAGVEWKSWDAAVTEAKKSGKMIMIDAVRDNCHYCTDMDKAVFQDDAFADYLGERFIPVKINISHETLPQDIECFMTPTFYFFTPDEKLIKQIPGSWNQEDFKDFLERIKP